MVRKERGRGFWGQAKGCLSEAMTVEELRQAQAVMCPRTDLT